MNATYSTGRAISTHTHDRQTSRCTYLHFRRDQTYAIINGIHPTPPINQNIPARRVDIHRRSADADTIKRPRLIATSSITVKRDIAIRSVNVSGDHNITARQADTTRAITSNNRSDGNATRCLIRNHCKTDIISQRNRRTHRDIP